MLRFLIVGQTRGPGENPDIGATLSSVETSPV